jgi:hypothetical protein
MWTRGRRRTVITSCMTARQCIKTLLGFCWVDSWDTSCELQPTSNDSCEMTYKTVDDAAYHFGVADKGLSVLHLRIDRDIGDEAEL